MTSPPAANFLRLSLAASILVTGITSFPMAGHSHALPESFHHIHSDWSTPGHAHDHAEECDEDHDAPGITADVFHFHGVCCGLPFTLPASREHQEDSYRHYPLPDACPTIGMSADACRTSAVGERIFC